MLILVRMEILADFKKLFQINVGTKPRLYCSDEWKEKNEKMEIYIYIYMQTFIGGILLKLLFRYGLNCYNMEMGFQHLKTEMNID